MKNIGIKISLIAAGLCIVFACASPVFGANYLKDISVQKAGDTVVVIISTSEPCQYEKLYLSGKPERIVIDLQGVLNVWTNKKFTNLSFKSVTSIRTSQFQNDPLISRVVLDIGRPIEFDVSQLANDILVKIPAAAGETDFQVWSTGKAPKKTAPAAARAAKEKTVTTPSATSRKTSAGVKIESAPKKTMVYRASKYRDPFMPLVGGVTGQFSTELPSLENLTLVGILSDIDGNRALLEDAEGNGYILMSNDKVKNGYLVSVSDTKAIFQITEYGWTRTVALELDIPELR